MSNYCEFSLAALGETRKVDELLSWLDLDSDALVHFARIFDCEVTHRETQGNLTYVECVGGCAWSTYSCMRSGPGTYYSEGQPGLVDLRTAALDLKCDIEVFDKEPGMGFASHVRYDAGGVLMEDETVDYAEAWWEPDEHESFQEFLDAYGIKGISSPEELDDGWIEVGGFDDPTPSLSFEDWRRRQDLAHQTEPR